MEITKETLELLKVLAAAAKCATTEEIMKITSLPKEVVESHLDILQQQGFILSNKEGKHCSFEDIRRLQEKFKFCEKCIKLPVHFSSDEFTRVEKTGANFSSAAY